MKRPYLWLGLAILAAAAVVTALGRAPSGDRRATTPAAAEIPPVEVSLEVRDGAVSPPVIRVEKGTRVRLRMTNAGTAAATIALPGYEDRFTVPRLEPGAQWSGGFLADRPGDDFAWVVNERPAGRFLVAGSHLVEGHR